MLAIAPAEAAASKSAVARLGFLKADTPQFADDRAQSSGSLTSVASVAAPADSGWWVYAILRSVGGARLVGVSSPVEHAPEVCPLS